MMTFPSNCPNNPNLKHIFFDGACLHCGIETPEKEDLYSYEFTLKELTTLYNLLQHEYISYENKEAHEVLNKISKIVNQK